MLFCASAFGQTPAAPPAAPAAIPLEHFTKFDASGGLKLSPDGQYYAMLTGKYGRSAVVFVEVKTKKVAGGVRAQDDCEIDEYHWISPTRLIYTDRSASGATSGRRPRRNLRGES